MIIDRIIVNAAGFSKKEAKKYVDYVNKHINFDRKHYELAEITITNCADDKVDIDWKVKGTKFERIRRITGYLTGDLRSWNDAKRAEEHERVKHDTKI